MLASASGLNFAFVFFLALSAVFSLAVFALLTRPSSRRTDFGFATVRTSIALPVALLVWLVVFAGIYLSSLAGFHQVSLDADGIHLAYTTPPRSVMVGYADVSDVTRRPAYRQQWYLEIYTRAGTRFQSAPGSHAAIKAAGEEIDRRRPRE